MKRANTKSPRKLATRRDVSHLALFLLNHCLSLCWWSCAGADARVCTVACACTGACACACADTPKKILFKKVAILVSASCNEGGNLLMD